MGILSKIFSSGAGELIKDVGGVIDNLTISKEEKAQLNIDLTKTINEHNEKLTEFGERELESYLKDTQSARDTNVKIQDSERASWLSKNIAYLLDGFLGLIWGIVTIFIVGKALKIIDNPVDMTAILSIYGTITAVFMTVINFHRGTSRSSEEKTKQINKMINGNIKYYKNNLTF